MNKKILGIILAAIAIVAGVLIVVVSISQMRQAAKGQQPALSKEEIQQTLTASQGETVSYEDSTVGVRLTHPKNWEKEVGQNSAVVFKIFGGAINVRFVSDDLTGNKEPVTLQEYTKELMNQSITLGEKQNVAIKALSDSDTTLAGLPAHQWLYTVALDSIKGSGMQVWTVKNNRSYVLTFTAPESLFDTFVPVFKKMLETVSITK